MNEWKCKNLTKEDREMYESVMSGVITKKIKIKPQLPPGDFIGW